MALDQQQWHDPWQWPEYLRMRRGLRIATVLMIASIAGAIPATWIVLKPTDPLLRPDLTTNWAWAMLGLCAVFAYFAQGITRRARARFDHALYKLTQATRDIAAAHDIAMEIELGESYPPVLVARQQRKIAIVGPSPLIADMEHVTVDVGHRGEPGAPPQPHLVLKLAGMSPDHVFIAPARGVVSDEQVRLLGQRLKDHMEPLARWKQPSHPMVDMASFVDSMRTQK